MLNDEPNLHSLGYQLSPDGIKFLFRCLADFANREKVLDTATYVYFADYAAKNYPKK